MVMGTLSNPSNPCNVPVYQLSHFMYALQLVHNLFSYNCTAMYIVQCKLLLLYFSLRLYYTDIRRLDSSSLLLNLPACDCGICIPLLSLIDKRSFLYNCVQLARPRFLPMRFFKILLGILMVFTLQVCLYPQQCNVDSQVQTYIITFLK